ncbi:MAG: ABC transporter substrate-binding protein [Anaerolineae bacterium]
MCGPLLVALLAMTGSGLTGCAPAFGVQSPETREPVVMRIAYGAAYDIENLPSLMVNERLAAQGYRIETVLIAKPEIKAEAVARGEVDLAFGSLRTYWAAIGKGADTQVVMESAGNGWMLMASRKIHGCADLGDARLAVQSEGSLTAVMADYYLRSRCPETEPQIVYIPGSETRAAALLAGNIEAAPMQLSSALLLERQASERLHALAHFGEELPDLVTSVVAVNGAFAREHPLAVQDYVRELLAVHRLLANDPEQAMPIARQYLEIPEESCAPISMPTPKPACGT